MAGGAVSSVCSNKPLSRCGSFFRRAPQAPHHRSVV